jgi:hypothetical protein
LSPFQSRKGDTCHKAVDRRSFIGGVALGMEGVNSIGFGRWQDGQACFRSSAGRVALRATIFATSHSASARASRRGNTPVHHHDSVGLFGCGDEKGVVVAREDDRRGRKAVKPPRRQLSRF